MIYEIRESSFIDILENGDLESVYVLNKYGDEVTLMADIENLNPDVVMKFETMRFLFPQELMNSNVVNAVVDVRSYYTGGIEVDICCRKDLVIHDIMKLYEGLLCRHYLITPDTTIDDISRLPDGIVYVYIMKEEKQWTEKRLKQKPKRQLKK